MSCIDQELSGSVAEILLPRERLQTWRSDIVRAIAEVVSTTGAQMGNTQVLEAATRVRGKRVALRRPHEMTQKVASQVTGFNRDLPQSRSSKSR